MAERGKHDAEVLRRKAEELLKKNKSQQGHKELDADILKIFHELEVHQIELEIQNNELRHAWAQSEEATNKFSALYDFAPTGYFTLSDNGRIIETNLAGSQLLGKERLHVTNNQFGFFVSDETRPVFNLFLQKIFNAKAKQTCEVTLSLHHNVQRFVYLAGILSENGKECLVTVADITALKQAEAEIILKNETLAKLIAEIDKFFSILAHDLRNPFNSLLGFTQLMVEEFPTFSKEEVYKIAVNIRKSATNLFRLLENLLEWSRLQRNLTGFDPVLRLLKPEINESIAFVRESAFVKNIEIIDEVSEKIKVFTDKYMLDAVLRNLITNAIKFTHKGGKIRISAKPLTNHSVEISVTDTGIGMKQSLLDKIFQIDEKTGRRGTEGEPSTGLGLILCKELVLRQGGKIEVDSKEGEGSRFYFTLPSKGE